MPVFVQGNTGNLNYEVIKYKVMWLEKLSSAYTINHKQQIQVLLIKNIGYFSNFKDQIKTNSLYHYLKYHYFFTLEFVYCKVLK